MRSVPRGRLDAWHAAVVDRVCAADAARVASGQRRFIRLLEAHELCLPTGCTSWGSNLVEVIAIADGLRIRRPFAAAEGAA
jgi:hypothetical protein